MNTATYLWTREDGEEVEIEVSFRCAPYFAAVVGRLPDRCYPAEGGDIEEIEFTAGRGCSPKDLSDFRDEYQQNGRLAERVDEKCTEVATQLRFADFDY